MKRIVSLLVFFGAVLNILVGCGSSGESVVASTECDHVFLEDGWQHGRSSNCNEQGYEERTCEKCSYAETRPLPLKDHTYINSVCTDCGESIPGSKGLTFTTEYVTSSNDWIAYLTGMGECTDTDVVVPAICQQGDTIYPVKGIAAFFKFPENVTSVTFLGPITSMPGYLFYNQNELKEVTFAEGQSFVEAGTFGNCTKLTEMVFPSSLSSIGAYAFSGCTALETVTIPGALTVIQEETFENCTALKEMILPEGLVRIKKRAFEGCTGMERIQLPASLELIEDYAFDGCSGLLSIDFPDEVTVLPAFVCSSSKSLKSVSMGKNVTHIDVAAFMNCFALESITLPASLEEIGKSAFSGCLVLETISFEGTVNQWNQIAKGENWNDSCIATVVQCTDGQVPLV